MTYEDVQKILDGDADADRALSQHVLPQIRNIDSLRRSFRSRGRNAAPSISICPNRC